MNSKPYMTQAEFGAFKQVGKSAVSNWKKRGLLIWAEAEDGRTLVDVAKTQARLNARLDPTRGRPKAAQAHKPAPSAPVLEVDQEPQPDMLKLRAELVSEQIEGRRIDNAKRAGELVPLASYEALLAELGKRVFERFEQMARNPTLVEELALLSDPAAIRIRLSSEITTVFEDVSLALKTGTPDELVLADDDPDLDLLDRELEASVDEGV